MSALEHRLEDFKECEECGAVYNKSKMKEVLEKEVITIYPFRIDRKIIYYCKKHSPKYDVVISRGWVGQKEYFIESLKVDENGKILTKK